MRASLFVAGPGVEPGLRDYEPHVQPYTTPHVERSEIRPWWIKSAFGG